MEELVAVVSVVLAIGIGAFLWWLRKNDDYWKKRGMPYEPRLSHLSFLKQLTNKPMHETTFEKCKKFGRIFGEFEFRSPALSVTDPDLLKDILVKDFQYFSCRKEQAFGEPMFDNMVVSLNGEDWKRVRTILTPAFTSRRMRQMSHIMNESSKSVVETYGKYADRGQPVDCKKIFGAFTIDVIASAAFATKIDSHNDPENVFVKHVRKMFDFTSLLHLLALMFMPSWTTRIFRFGVLKSLDFYKDVILDVIEERQQGGKKYNDFLQLVLDAQEDYESEIPKDKTSEQEDESDQFGSVLINGTLPQLKYSNLSEEEIVAQCVLFFMVGYETTASTLSHVAYCLALNEDCQEKLIREVDEVFEKHNGFSHDVIRDMKYLDCVVSETLRMYPSLTTSERTAVEDYHLRKHGTVIEKGVIVKFHIYAMHHDPEFFADPEKFNPERFLPENASHPLYAYLPFGAGPRNCLGMRFALMEIKLCVCNVLRHYRFKRAPSTKVPLEYSAGGFMSAKEVTLLVERRNFQGKNRV